MLWLGFRCLILLAVWFSASETATADLRALGPQGVNLWRLNHAAQRHSQDDLSDSAQHSFSTSRAAKKYSFRSQWFQQPLDHFDKSSKHSFHQRYWVSSRHYKPRNGAPVIVLDGGETSGEVRCSPPLIQIFALLTLITLPHRIVYLSWTPALLRY